MQCRTSKTAAGSSAAKPCVRLQSLLRSKQHCSASCNAAANGSQQMWRIGCGISRDMLWQQRGAQHSMTVCRAAAEEVQDLTTEAWNAVEAAVGSNKVFDARVLRIMDNGVQIDIIGITGFIPMRLLAGFCPTKTGKGDIESRLHEGDTVQVVVKEAARQRRRLLCSEVDVVMSRDIGTVRRDSTVRGTVSGITDFGAFVQLQNPDGTFSGLYGLIAKKELSWDVVMRCEDIVQVGQEVEVKVTSKRSNPPRIGLSLRQLQPDPLRTNIQQAVLPEEGAEGLSNIEWTDATEPLQGLEDILVELRGEEGIEDARVCRQAETRVVSQDLELWLSRDEVEGGFNVVARANKRMQQVLITTKLSRDAVRDALSRVLKRVL